MQFSTVTQYYPNPKKSNICDTTPRTPHPPCRVGSAPDKTVPRFSILRSTILQLGALVLMGAGEAGLLR